MRLFKYFNAETGLIVLRNMTFRISLATELNDPFELAPNVPAEQFSVDFFRRRFREKIYFEQEYRERGGPKGLNRRTFRTQYLAALPALVAERAAAGAKILKTEFAAIFENHWGLLCACTNQISIPMWAYYADEHRGMLLEFDSEIMGFTDDVCPYPVIYSSERPSWVHHSDYDKYFSEMVRIARTKSDTWRHEEEYRILVPRSATPLIDRRFVPIYAGALISITFGCRTSDETKRDVRSIIGQSSVELRRAVQHDSQYDLRIQPA